jgi:hypothetical protein
MDELYSIPGEPLELRGSDTDIKNIIIIICITLLFNIMYISCSISRLPVKRNPLIHII